MDVPVLRAGRCRGQVGGALLGRGNFQREFAAETNFAMRRDSYLARPRGALEPAELEEAVGEGDAEAAGEVGASLGPVVAGFAGARRVRDPEVLKPGGARVGEEEDLALSVDQGTREHRVGDPDPEAAGEVAVASAGGAESARAP